MAKAEKTNIELTGGDFVTTEIDRLIHSAEMRLEQQQIHIQELSDQIGEKVRARHQLQVMLSGYEKLLALRKQLGQPR